MAANTTMKNGKWLLFLSVPLGLLLAVNPTANAFGKPKIRENLNPKEIVDAQIEVGDEQYYLGAKVIGPRAAFDGVPPDVLNELKQLKPGTFFPYCPWSLEDGRYVAQIPGYAVSKDEVAVIECPLLANGGSHVEKSYAPQLLVPGTEPQNFKVVVRFNGPKGLLSLDQIPDVITWRMVPSSAYQRLLGNMPLPLGREPLPTSIKGVSLGTSTATLRKQVADLPDSLDSGGEIFTDVSGSRLHLGVVSGKVWRIAISANVGFADLAKAKIAQHGQPTAGCHMFPNEAYGMCAREANRPSGGPCEETCGGEHSCLIWEDDQIRMQVSARFLEAEAALINGVWQRTCHNESELTERFVVLSIEKKSKRLAAKQAAEDSVRRAVEAGERRKQEKILELDVK